MKHINILLLGLLGVTIFTGWVHAQEPNSDLIWFSDLTHVQDASEKARSKNRAKIYFDSQGQKWVVKDFHEAHRNYLMVNEYVGAKILKFIQGEGIAEVKLIKDLPGHVAVKYMEEFNTCEFFVKTFRMEWDKLHISNDAYGTPYYRDYLLKNNFLNKKIENYEALWASMDFIRLGDRTIWNQGYIVKKDGSIIAARVDYDFSFSSTDVSLLEANELTEPLVELMKQAGWDMNKYYGHLEKISKIPVSEFIEIIENAAKTLKNAYPEMFESDKFKLATYNKEQSSNTRYYYYFSNQGSYYYFDLDEYINCIKNKVLEQHAHIKDVVKKVNQDHIDELYYLTIINFLKNPSY